ncbi:dual specificity protein phosphatase 22-B-like isoform X1 [Gouania willdenowi]|uniref:dual specificity protein phosphatase 22-B-like isoform X1 n=1 Tax=Gouania willdenowi TaxID=441366 RepID=UPI001056AD10|nr:dual specificity protein phosphatase 22 isoform X1 [Gouania willdenowi]
MGSIRSFLIFTWGISKMQETVNCWKNTTSPTSCPYMTRLLPSWSVNNDCGQDKTYLCIRAADHSKHNLTQYFRESIVFIHECRLRGEGCLVHCVAGVSRSVTLVVAYVMTVTGRGWVESLAAVRCVRPCAGPNLGFLRQLEEFENLQLTQYRSWWTERYGNKSFNDNEEIQNLLSRTSNGSC